jgi:protein-tyrosine phosphatase
VHCGSGVGRAPTMAAAYLVSTGLSADQAWALIRKTRPFIKPTQPQLAALEQFVAEAEYSQEGDSSISSFPTSSIVDYRF